MIVNFLSHQNNFHYFKTETFSLTDKKSVNFSTQLETKLNYEDIGANDCGASNGS